jgi:outer membrane protein OmpA-like peptidoglycan-associated protein
MLTDVIAVAAPMIRSTAMHLFRSAAAIALLSLLSLLPGLAHADAVTLALSNQVPLGKKPSITIVAQEAVSAITLDIKRLDDNKTFHVKAGPLAVGGQAVLAIGDGKSGRARWEGHLSVRAASGESGSEVNFVSNTGSVGGGLKVGYDRAHLDLEHGKLEFTLSRAAQSASLIVVTDDGTATAQVNQSLAGEKPGKWIAITFPPATRPVLRLELTVKTVDGDSVMVKLVPWSISIPHEEVVFASGDATVQPSEEKKLDASYQKIVDAVDQVRRQEPNLDVRVFVAGHTDTVGTSADNRKLSQARARSIAKWFHDRGLPLPLYYAGFGEDQLRVKTADNVDEARNRRADYVVGVEEPAFGRGHFVELK